MLSSAQNTRVDCSSPRYGPISFAMFPKIDMCVCAHTAAQQSPILAGQEGGSTGLESARCMRVKGVILTDAMHSAFFSEGCSSSALIARTATLA